MTETPLRNAIAERVKLGEATRDIVNALSCSVAMVTKVKRWMRSEFPDVPRDPYFKGGGAQLGNQLAVSHGRPRVVVPTDEGNAAWRALADDE